MHHPRRISGPTARVVIIGAGLAGLSAALHLRGAGHEVTVLESADVPGGLVRTDALTAADGSTHRFDTGATILTMPDLALDALAAAGVDRADAQARLDLRRVDPSYLARFADGTELAVAADRARRVEAVAQAFGTTAAAGTEQLSDWLQALYDVEFPTFIDRNHDRLIDFLRGDTASATRTLVRLGAVRGLTGAINRFVTDDRLQRVFSFQSLYAGVSPARAAAIYGVIAHMDIGMGVSYPAAGMGRLPAVLAGALVDAGVDLRYSTTARRLIRRNRRATGVVVTAAGGRDEVVAADAVVAACGRSSLTGLLGASPRRRIRYSPSAVVAHLAVDIATTSTWPGDHHTIDFGARWEETFAQIVPRRRGRGEVMTDPSVLLTRPAVTAPEVFITSGRESVSVLWPCPNLEAAALPWPSAATGYVARSLGLLADRGYTGITDAEVLRIDTPSTWADRGYAAGTPFAAAHTVRQTGPLRTANLAPGWENLVLAGADTVPGVGIPPVLVSGRLAADRITPMPERTPW
ncbi:phytoene desaturase family protein [Gordonia defluvii]|uniref:Phytoene desaturase family protein n=1 Tax=Gordonia defluvii TaxID=283718 RepID=A0ABP6LB14_9ACTN|nr:phytoene desaturase family protein [Gordonia sp. UBA5067]